MEKISREQMLEEAVSRMQGLGLDPEVIGKLRIDGAVGVCEAPFGAIRFLEGAEMEKVRKIEEGYDVLIYVGIRDRMWNGVMESFLFVSGNPDEWKDERESLGEMEPYAFVIGWDCPDRPELGLIGLGKPSCDGLERTW